MQVTALFAISAAAGRLDEISQLPADTILIYHRFIPSGTGTVSICEIFYRTEQGLRYAARRDYANDCTSLRQQRWLARLNLYYLLINITGQTPNPWGILSGVRPAKLVHRMLDQGRTLETILKSLKQEFALQPEKAQLVTGVALRQRPFLLRPEELANKVSVYIGIPFCPTRCLYCSFPAYVLPGEEATQAFLTALFADMAAAKEALSRYGLSVQTVYIGGGTPTSLALTDLDALLAQAVTLFAGEAAEFTVEAGRPDSLDDAKIRLLVDYGVTRVSVNPQTMQQKTLKLIGRMHSVQDIICIFEKIRICNIPVVNMDIIAGLPGECETDMADTLRQIAALKPDNLTVHTLALKRGSRLCESVEAYEAPDAVVTAKMLSLADQTAKNLGMQPYYLYRQKRMAGNLENIGYSLPGKECIYNIQVIEERQTILGIGPSATTKVVQPCGLTNYYHPKDISTYINTLPDRLQKRNALLAAALAK
jgi:oxygen-independent coproporphyrinogen-3 oxidase